MGGKYYVLEYLEETQFFSMKPAHTLEAFTWERQIPTKPTPQPTCIHFYERRKVKRRRELPLCARKKENDSNIFLQMFELKGQVRW